MRTRFLLAAWLAAASLPSQASAQTPGFAEQVDEETLRVLSPVLDAAAGDSLPVAALEAKALEGLVKGYPPTVIVPALQRLADDFRLTRDSLRSQMPGRVVAETEVVAASLARGQGVPSTAITQLMSGTPTGSMEIPVAVLGELVRRGLPVDDAVWIVDHVIAQDIAMSQVTQIPGRFDLASRSASGGRPAVLRALQSLGISPPGPRRPPGPPGPSAPTGGE